MADRQAFMDRLVEQTIQRLDTEPIDLYTHPTYLSTSLKGQADKLWTPTRQAKLIEALMRNQVAIELNTREQ